MKTQILQGIGESILRVSNFLLFMHSNINSYKRHLQLLFNTFVVRYIDLCASPVFMYYVASSRDDIKDFESRHLTIYLGLLRNPIILGFFRGSKNKRLVAVR